MQDISLYNEFAEEAGLNKRYGNKRRSEEMEMAMFEILLGSEDMDAYHNWWWDDFVGVKFMGLIRWDRNHFERHGVKKIKDVVTVQMVKNVYMQTGRSIAPDCLVMI